METNNSEFLNINVTLCDRPYRLKVKPEEEQQVRKAAKYISDKVRNLQEEFAGKDKQDYLAMCALTLGVDKFNLESDKSGSDSDVLKDLIKLEKQIEKALNT